MSTINITSNGKAGSLNHTVTYSNGEGSRDPRYCKLYVYGRNLAAILRPVSASPGSNASATFSSSDIDIGWLRDCSDCSFVTGRYVAKTEYKSPVDGTLNSVIVAQGSVAVSGPTGCLDCGDTEPPPDDGGGDDGGGGGGGDDDFGPIGPGDEPPPKPATPANPCLPTPYSPPPVPVPTPCASGTGTGTGPGGFGNP